MSIDLIKYKKIYLETANEKLSLMLKLLEDLQKSRRKEALEEFHRLAHSLKSQSLVMGYAHLGFAAKQLESLFRMINDDSIILTDNLIIEVRKLVDHIVRSVRHIETEGRELDIAKGVQMLEEKMKTRVN